MSKPAKRILFIVPYPLGIAPSQRFRFEQYFDLLTESGFSFSVRPFLDEQAMQILYRPGKLFLKIWKVKLGFWKRILDLFTLHKFDVVFIHREAAPIGPPVFEWLITKVFRKKVVFDFDDAIWLSNTSASNPFITFFKRYRNAENTAAWAWKVSCGNAYLRNHAAKFNAKAIINPTTIDTENLHNQVKQYSASRTKIGWTGTHSTMKYLHRIIPILQKLEAEFDFELLVIADHNPHFDLRNYQFVAWNKSTEIDDLLKMDVGIMPLEDDRWAQGKCGFKALQYMALGIPAIVSPVGVNTEIVSHGANGWICDSDAEWEQCFRTILANPAQLPQLSTAARKTVVDRYSVVSNENNFLELFRIS